MRRMVAQPSMSVWGQHGDRPLPASVKDSLFAAFYATATLEVDCEPNAAWALITTIGRTGGRCCVEFDRATRYRGAVVVPVQIVRASSVNAISMRRWWRASSPSS